jgi:hypothetical protein
MADKSTMSLLSIRDHELTPGHIISISALHDAIQEFVTLARNDHDGNFSVLTRKSFALQNKLSFGLHQRDSYYAHDFDFFGQCADEFEAMCRNRKSSAEEPRLIGAHEITCIRFIWGYRQIRFVHVWTCACTEIDLVCLLMCMAMQNLVHISAR